RAIVKARQAYRPARADPAPDVREQEAHRRGAALRRQPQSLRFQYSFLCRLFEGGFKAAIAFFARRQPLAQPFELEQAAICRILPTHRKQGARESLDLLRRNKWMRVEHAVIKTRGGP